MVWNLSGKRLIFYFNLFLMKFPTEVTTMSEVREKTLFKKKRKKFEGQSDIEKCSYFSNFSLIM